MLRKYPFLLRFLSKLTYEFLPAAVASAIGAVLLSHFARPPVSTPPTVVADPANAELMQMLRDEHARVVVYLEKNGEVRQLAEIAAEKEKLQRKIAEDARRVTARKVKSAETRQASIATAADKAKKISVSARQQDQPSEEIVGEPLQLSGNVAARAEATAVRPAAEHGKGSFLVAQWRETTATVERIPGWVRTMAEKISHEIPSVSLPRLPPLKLI